MTPTPTSTIALSAVIGLVLAASSTVHETRTIDKTFPIKGNSPAHLVVDNLHGIIHVRAGATDRITVQATETLKARNQERAAIARREVDLLIRQEGNHVVLYVDGPFRKKRGTEWSPRQYVVRYDFEIRVPTETDLELKTVNGNDVLVEGVHGDYKLFNTNGSIKLEGVAGSGTARTVNGEVEARFVAPPTADSRFATINGDVDVTMPPDLSADLHLKTQHGDLWSEFPVTLLPQPTTGHRKARGTSFRIGGSWSVARVADGGPSLYLETLNGDITVRSDAP